MSRVLRGKQKSKVKLRDLLDEGAKPNFTITVQDEFSGTEWEPEVMVCDDPDHPDPWIQLSIDLTPPEKHCPGE